MDEVVLLSADGELVGLVGKVLGQDACLRACARSEEAAGALLDASVLLLDSRQPPHGLLEAAQVRDVPAIVLLDEDSPAQVVPWLDAGAADCLPAARLTAEGRARVTAQCRVRRRLCELQAGALVDPLTGAYNRRFLQGRLAAQLSEAERYEQPLSVLLLDLDELKRVNDTLGHLFGDQVLRQLAELVQRRVRREDVLARYGGEEFVLLLPHTYVDGAAALAERVRQAVADHEFAHAGRACRITVSVGGAAHPRDSTGTADGLLQRADERLYWAKQAGRNRVVAA